GVWMHLYRTMDELQKKKIRFYDPRKDGYKYLSFMVKGKNGNEIFTVGVADEEKLKSEDTLKIGTVSDFLGRGVTREWQEVVIPLDDMGIDLSTFGLINFDFTEPGDYTVYIDNVCFKKKKDTVVNVPSSTFIKKVPKAGLTNAMWVWLAEDILFNDKNQNELLAFCKQRNIQELFFQILYEFTGSKEKNDFRCTLLHPDSFRKFIRNASKNHIRIHALEGYPDWVMRERHHEPLAFCRAICDYNRSSAPDERFYGIHLDNEPYLMIAYKSPLRTRICREYIELNDKLTRLVKENSSMVFGIDIPFFFDQPDEKSGKIELVEYQGKKKPVSEHLLDIVDNVGIMGYRDFAFGADGMIFHSRGEMDYAEKAGKKVYMGIETFKYPLIPVYFVTGYPREQFFKRLQKEAKDFAFTSRINGFRIQTFDDGKSIHVGIEIPEKLKDQKKLNDTIKLIGEKFGRNEFRKKDKTVDQLLENIEFGLSSDVEWENCEPSEWTFDASRETYRGFKSYLIMLPKITFAEEDLMTLDRELKAYQYEFSRKRSFYGFAIHYYDVYKKLK
ncbi:MAG: hypothetical protein PHF84_12920, partial [bacterium]|nr:hypothetical protein [bacterium]